MSSARQILNGQSLVTVLAHRGRYALLAGIGFMHHASADAAFKGIDIPEILFYGKLVDFG
jgi:hypothetical protein